MLRRRVNWHRLFAVYFTVAGVGLVAGVCRVPPAGVWLWSGLVMLLGFVPLVMLAYFLKGLLRIP